MPCVGESKVTLLGHVVLEKGIEVDPEKIHSLSQLAISQHSKGVDIFPAEGKILRPFHSPSISSSSAAPTASTKRCLHMGRRK